jgi:hypothetical protein
VITGIFKVFHPMIFWFMKSAFEQMRIDESTPLAGLIIVFGGKT